MFFGNFTPFPLWYVNAFQALSHLQYVGSTTMVLDPSINTRGLEDKVPHGTATEV